MLSKEEIKRLLNKRQGADVMPDARIMNEAKDWLLFNTRLNPRLLALVYSYINHSYKDSETLDLIERKIGISADLISLCLRELEDRGYVAISRQSKPFRYAVIK